MIVLRDVALQRGNKQLFQNVNLSFFTKQKIGVVGKNGSGKSSLFSLILGELQADHGSIDISKKLQIVYLQQEMPDSQRSCIDYVIDADVELRAIEKQLNDLQNKAESDVQGGELLGELFAHYERLSGYSAHARAAALLDGLGFSSSQQNQPVNSLSGGWRMQLNLARALFCHSAVLLLDEPTNHLDLDAVVWLEQFLRKYSGLLLLISHDRDFLDNIVTHIAHVEHQTITFYTGNYSSFEKQYAEQLELQQKMFAKQQAQMQHWQVFIDRFRAKTSKARQVQSRIKALERMQSITVFNEENDFVFDFLRPKHLPHTLVEMREVSFAYADQPLFNKINLKITRESRLGLLGRNGAGKSTLIKLLIGELMPQSGVVVRNDNLKVGYFAQHQLDQLIASESALQNLERNNARDVTMRELRTFLGSFGFSGDSALQEVGTFSGGEKTRLALAIVVWQQPNLLLLDEPTNNLDYVMRQALIVALQNYQGAVIIVSHDRFLLRSTVDEFYLVAKQKVHVFSGDLDDYQQWLTQNESLKCAQGETKKREEVIKRPRSTSNQKQSAKIEKQLEMLYAQIDELKLRLSDQKIYAAENSTELQKYLQQYKEVEEKIKRLEEEWVLHG